MHVSSVQRMYIRRLATHFIREISVQCKVERIFKGHTAPPIVLPDTAPIWLSDVTSSWYSSMEGAANSPHRHLAAIEARKPRTAALRLASRLI